MTGKLPRILLIPSVAIAIVIAGYDISQWLRAAPFWADEEMIAINLRDRSFVDLAGPLWLGQSAPLAWLLLQRIVIAVFGTADMVLRLVPLAFGIATVGVAAWVGQRWMHRTSAVLLVLLCGLGQWLSFYRFEMKHYSADAFWALLLPALGAWAVDTDSDDAGRRWTIWWVAAALGQFFANGALLVTPMCAVVMMLIVRRNQGWRRATRFATIALVWLVAAGMNYEVSLQYTHHSRFLRDYWATAFPPQSAGLFSRLGWIAERLGPLAMNPTGTTLGIALWACAIFGFAFTGRRTLGALFATVPVSAFLLALMRLVPLSDRLSLWIVPSLYIGLVLLFDAASDGAVRAWRAKRWLPLPLCAIAGAAPLFVTADILNNGTPKLEFSARESNHGLDDRSAVGWIMDRRLPGDALLTTHLGWPAMWWYGQISLAQRAPRGELQDGSVMYEILHERERPGCAEQIRTTLRGHRRVLVHGGFPDMPDGFFDLALRELSAFGSVSEIQRFADFSTAAVVTLDESSMAGGSPPEPTPAAAGELSGCLGFRTARRW
ncbi:MAG: hypothetical protein ABIS06_15870 [Vicinamibacterales bacterium]